MSAGGISFTGHLQLLINIIFFVLIDIFLS